MTDAEYALLRRTCRGMLLRWRCWRRWSEDELVSWGWWGLECARRLYDPAKGPWVPFARAKIRNAVCDHIRQNKWRRESYEGPRLPELVYHRATWPEALWDYTKTLTPRQQEAIYWRYRDGLTLREMGEHWGLTESAAWHVLHAAHARVREYLDEHGQ